MASDEESIITSYEKEETSKKVEDMSQKNTKSGGYKRFIALIFIIIVAFCYSTLFDMPGSLQTIIQDLFHIPSYEFEYLYSVYAFPNIIFCFFSGILLDRTFGLRYGTLLFSAIGLIGQTIITVGGLTDNFWVMLVGRFVYGIGGETVILSLNCFTYLWFKGNECNFVFGLFLSITRLGSSFDFLISTPLFDYIKQNVSVNNAFGITILLFLFFSIIMVLSVAFLGYFSDKNNKKSQSNEVVNFKQILQFPLIFWILLIMLSTANNTVFAFISISQKFLHEKFDISTEKADYLTGIFNTFSAIFCPLPGIVIDKVGRDITFSILGCVLGVIALLIMSFLNVYPLVPLILYSICFSMLNTCAWPLVAKAVEPYQLATAFGTLHCLVNFVGTIIDIVVGVLLDKYGPDGPAYLFLACLVFSTFCCIFIWYLDKRNNGSLNLSARERNAIINNQ